MNTKNIIFAALYFILSIIITWWFIVQGELLYFSQNKMLLSCTIAGGKWCIQIVAALLLLKNKKWEFIYRIGLTCFIGSCLLLPYCFIKYFRNIDNAFLISIIIAVATMIIMYYYDVVKTNISKVWFLIWLFCLAIAISLQLFVVFKI